MSRGDLRGYEAVAPDVRPSEGRHLACNKFGQFI
jgi:hypothetical protein